MGRLFWPALFVFAALAACAGPTPRDTTVDSRAGERVEKLKPEVRPEIQPTEVPDADLPQLQKLVAGLSSSRPLDRLQAATRLRQAGTEGVMVAAAHARHNQWGERALMFVADADLSELTEQQLATVRADAAAGLNADFPAVRAAAAEVLMRHGPGLYLDEFLNAIRDEDRRVRWAVTRRLREHPLELAPGQIVRLVEFLADAKLAGAVRADVHAILLHQHQTRNETARPPSYDAFKDPATQQSQLDAWRAWAGGLK